VPRLTVQPLVENAVIHGISRLRARGVLHVSARVEGEQLILEVENPLAPEESAINRGTGIAINNIAQRLKLIYGDRARLTLGEERTDYGGVYRARLRVPLILAAEQQEEGSHR
jgi:Putative regulator of cell autolysis